MAVILGSCQTPPGRPAQGQAAVQGLPAFSPVALKAARRCIGISCGSPSAVPGGRIEVNSPAAQTTPFLYAIAQTALFVCHMEPGVAGRVRGLAAVPVVADAPPIPAARPAADSTATKNTAAVRRSDARRWYTTSPDRCGPAKDAAVRAAAQTFSQGSPIFSTLFTDSSGGTGKAVPNPPQGPARAHGPSGPCAASPIWGHRSSQRAARRPARRPRTGVVADRHRPSDPWPL